MGKRDQERRDTRKMMIRSKLLTAAMAIIATFCSPLLKAQSPATTSAPAYPSKPIKFMVGFATGGAADVTARMLAPKLSELLGQQIVIENRGGSGGLLATDAVAKSPADGYTLLLMPAADTVQPALRRKLPYDLERDFAPVSRVVYGPWFVVVSIGAGAQRRNSPHSRASPGKLNYASSGIGSWRMANELFNSLAKVNIVHVP